ncbi:phage tail family protein [Occultella gossypii]|uniref:Phage tail family protein n=1 Tax=Occultella gossypii TaxID=2800820 RepID=A0ABS7SAA5_9MICO|nr:phage tail family protein [Occultella gossypii]MBZ2197279.1 phage tail family protein [Occultella gossypii]
MYLGPENYLGTTAYLGPDGDVAPTFPLGTLAVTVDGVTFFGSVADGDWSVQEEGIEGWFDGAPVRSDAPDRPGQHGQFGLPAYRGGRTVGLSVQCETRSDLDIGAARRVVTSILADGEYGLLTVVEPDGHTTSAAVRLNGQPLVRTDGWRSATAQIELFAPDPYRYGPKRQHYTTLPELVGGLEFDLFTDGTVDTGYLEFGEQGSTGRVILTNEGTAPYFPDFEVRGPAPGGFTLTNVETGRQIVSSTVIPAGSTLTVRSAIGVATLDGVDRSGQLVRREWTPVPKQGSSEWAFSAPTFTAAALVASVRDAWW